MNMKSLLNKISKEFDLEFDPKNRFKYLVLTNKEIIIRNFLGKCPDPIYVKHGNKDIGKVSDNLIRYLQTNDYKEDLMVPQACVISQKELKEELKLISKIPDIKTRQETKRFYNKIKQEIGKSKRLTLIWKPTKKLGEGYRGRNRRKEIILHEFVHELLEDNKIRPKSWKWNEGLVTYITHFIIEKLYRFEKDPILNQSKMWDIYVRYTRKWINLLKNIKDPKERKQIILKKVKEIDRKYKNSKQHSP